MTTKECWDWVEEQSHGEIGTWPVSAKMKLFQIKYQLEIERGRLGELESIRKHNSKLSDMVCALEDKLSRIKEVLREE